MATNCPMCQTPGTPSVRFPGRIGCVHHTCPMVGYTFSEDEWNRRNLSAADIALRELSAALGDPALDFTTGTIEDALVRFTLERIATLRDDLRETERENAHGPVDL